MCYEGQAIGFYYEHDKETDKLYAKPVYAASDETDSGGQSCRLRKSLVWGHSSCVHPARAATLRSRRSSLCCFHLPETTCCTTKAPQIKCCFKRGTKDYMCSFMPSCSRTFFNQSEQCCFVVSDGQWQYIIGRGGSSNQIHFGFCHPQTSNYKAQSPYSPFCSSNSPIVNNNQTTVNSQQQNYPLTPASTSSEHSPQLCAASTPVYFSGLYSPETPNSAYWLVSSSSLVPEECDWHLWIDEIIEEVRGEIRSETIVNQSHKNAVKQREHASLKRKESSSTDSSDDIPPSSKRAKKYSLSVLSHEQLAQRKKEQNRIAAQRYRSRKHQTLEEGRSEIGFLEKRNADLRLDIYAMEQEIRQLKEVLVNGPGAVELDALSLF